LDSRDGRKRFANEFACLSHGDPPRKEKYVSPLERRVEHMSRLYKSDGLSILARYMSVAAIAVASPALPLKSAANEQARDDQVKVEASEDEARSERAPR
jgi:hypothetical protein